jgi:hypothetical protein
MTTPLATRPAVDEHLEYYAKYIKLVPDGNLIDTLSSQHAETMRLVSANAGRGDHAYGPGKWTVKEVLGHIADAERIFTYRALRFARADRTPVPGFDENAYVANANFSAVPFDVLVDELKAVRQATLMLARQLDDVALTRRGTANDAEVSVRALFYIVAGHERHHVAILRERYGLA